MEKLDELLFMWAKDAEIDRTEPGQALIQIPILHSKYLNILSRHRMLAKEAEFKYNKIKKLKWEYYTGKLDEDELNKRGWQPFPYVVKGDLSTYMESDDDINKCLASKAIHEEIVEVCQAILKELNNRAWELKSFIDWEKFIRGI